MIRKSREVALLQHVKPNIYRDFKGKHLRGKVRCGEGLAYLQEMRSRSADIVFLDPPFNLGKRYSENLSDLDKKSPFMYESWLLRVLEESIRVLSPGGALYVYHMPRWAVKIAGYLQRELNFRHWIAVSMKNGFVRSSKNLYPAHYALLYYTKGDPGQFARPKIEPKKCRHCGNLVKDYGGYRKYIEKGLNLSDFWEDTSPVRHSNRKHRSANELPEVLFQRILDISGAPGMRFVDPFSGTGSGAVLAARRRLTFDTCDLVEDNCRILCERLEKLRINAVKVRE